MPDGLIPQAPPTEIKITDHGNPPDLTHQPFAELSVMDLITTQDKGVAEPATEKKEQEVDPEVLKLVEADKKVAEQKKKSDRKEKQVDPKDLISDQPKDEVVEEKPDETKLRIPFEPEKEEKKTEAKEESDELPKKASEANAAFRAQRKEIKELREKLAELEKNPPAKQEKVEVDSLPEYVNLKTEFERTKNELEQVKKAYEEAEARASIADVRGSKEYQSKVIEPYNKKVVGTIAEIAKDNDIDPHKLRAIVENQDKAARKQAFREISESLESYDQNKLLRAIETYDELAELDKQLLANPKKTVEEMRRQQEQLQREFLEEDKGRYAKAIKAIHEQFTERVPQFKRGKNEQVNKVLDQAEAIVNSLNVFELPPEKRAALIYNSVYYPMLADMQAEQIKHIQSVAESKTAELQDRIKELEDEVEALKSSSPAAGEGRADNDSEEKVYNPAELNAAMLIGQR